jgi:Winged helix-turn-helix DNA-binding
MLVTDFLDKKHKEINDRLAELTPLVDEYHRLEAAAAALNGLDGPPSRASASMGRPAPRSRRGPGRPRGSRNTPKSASKVALAATPRTAARPARGRRGRRKGTGQRSTEALALIQGQPGITISELATKMGIKQNYFYRILPTLEKEGKITKDGRSWHPKRAVPVAA